MKNKLCPNCDIHSFDDSGVCSVCGYKHLEEKEIKVNKKIKVSKQEGE